MIRLAEIAAQYAPELLKQSGQLLHSQRAALSAFQNCRSAGSPKMQLACDQCDHEIWLPHSCGNRHCPHCQAHESQRWIDQQLQKLVPGNYFMITFTLPAEFRSLAWHNQRVLYELITHNAWDTVNTFSQNDKNCAAAQAPWQCCIPTADGWTITPCASGDARRSVRCQTTAVARKRRWIFVLPQSIGRSVPR